MSRKPKGWIGVAMFCVACTLVDVSNGGRFVPHALLAGGTVSFAALVVAWIVRHDSW